MCPQFLETALGSSHCESGPNSESQLPKFCLHLEPQISTHSAALPDSARNKVATWFEVAGEIGLGMKGFLFYIPCSFPSYRRGRRCHIYCLSMRHCKSAYSWVPYEPKRRAISSLEWVIRRSCAVGSRQQFFTARLYYLKRNSETLWFAMLWGALD